MNVLPLQFVIHFTYDRGQNDHKTVFEHVTKVNVYLVTIAL